MSVGKIVKSYMRKVDTSDRSLRQEVIPCSEEWLARKIVEEAFLALSLLERT
jgi:hypothetical protein